jgi:hypothetical protein
MKNVSKFKNPLLFISTLLAFVFSFSACERKHRYELYVFTDGTGLAGNVSCDSFQMISTKECIIWGNGAKMRVVGNAIKPSSK